MRPTKLRLTGKYFERYLVKKSAIPICQRLLNEYYMDHPEQLGGGLEPAGGCEHHGGGRQEKGGGAERAGKERDMD